MKILPANREVLSRRFKVALRRIEAAADGSVTCSAEGVLTRQGQSWRPGGTTPQRLTRRWLQGVKLSSGAVYAVSGFGTGEHLKALLDRMDKESVLFAAESDPAALAAVLATVDCSAMLRDERFLLGTGSLDDDFFLILQGVRFYHMADAVPALYGPCHARDESYYNRFFSQFVRSFEHWFHLYKTNVEDSAFWLEQTLGNLPEVVDAPDVREVAPLVQDLPLILIGAGPSLDDSIEFLRHAQDRAVLAVVNSAYRKVTRNGIRPHLTVAVDPRIHTARGYYDCDVSGTTLLTTCFVHPGVVQMFRGRTFCWGGQNPIVAEAWKTFGRLESSTVLEKGTVSACILDLARLWGTKKVCLVGQDMALSVDGWTHTRESFYADSANFRNDLKDTRTTPGNTLKAVPVQTKHLVFLKTFEEFVRDNPAIDFVNTAAQGARITGVPYQTYEEALDWLGQKDTAGLADKLIARAAPAVEDGEPADRVRRALQPVEDFSRHLLELALAAAVTGERISDRLDAPNYARHPDVEHAMHYADEVNRWLDRHPREWHVLFEGATKRELAQYARNKHRIEARTDHMRIVRENTAYFWALAEGAHFLIARLEALLQERAGCESKHLSGV